MPLCCTTRINDLLEDASNLAKISRSSPQHLSSACHCVVQNCIYCSKPFSVFVSCCLVRKPRIRNARLNLRIFLQKLYLAHIPKTYFPAIQFAVSNAGNKQRNMQRGNELSSEPAVCDAKPMGNDSKQSSNSISYIY
jgi:hypothetical protein